jgi:hypothetical protein
MIFADEKTSHLTQRLKLNACNDRYKPTNMWGTYSWTVQYEFMENKFPCVGINPESLCDSIFGSESLYQIEVLCAPCKRWYWNLLLLPVGAQTLVCNPTAEALNATKLIACIRMEIVWLTLVTGWSSGVVLNSAQKSREKRSTAT